MSGQAQGTSVTVEIYDQVYHLRGMNEEHVTALAALVDTKMRSVAARSATADSLRVAVLAALNLADELTLLRERASKSGIDERTSQLHGLLDSVLADERQAG
jgi:cell division protein ZapA